MTAVFNNFQLLSSLSDCCNEIGIIFGNICCCFVQSVVHPCKLRKDPIAINSLVIIVHTYNQLQNLLVFIYLGYCPVITFNWNSQVNLILPYFPDSFFFPP